MEGHGVPISLVRGDQPKEESKGIENSRLEMGPEGNPSEYVGVPERYRLVKMNLVVKELLDGEIKACEIIAYQALASKNNFPKQEKGKGSQKSNRHDVPLVDMEELGHILALVNLSGVPFSRPVSTTAI
jgi:hypothetical protein